MVSKESLLHLQEEEEEEEEKHKCSVYLRILIFFLGVVEWFPARKHVYQNSPGSVCLIDGLRRKRKMVCFLSLMFLVLLLFTSTFAAGFYLYCYFGRMNHFLRFVSFQCYWPSLVSVQIFCLIALLRKQYAKDKHERDITWVNIFSEASFAKKVCSINQAEKKFLPKGRLFLCVFLPFPVFITFLRLLFFSKLHGDCRDWLSFVWIISESVNVFFFAYFCYFIYLQRLALENSCELTMAFIDTHIGDLENCIAKTREYFKEYFQLRTLLLPWISFVIFNATFGITVVVTWNYHLNMDDTNKTTTHHQFTTTVPPPQHGQGRAFCSITYACDKISFLREEYVFLLYNVLVLSRHFMTATLSYFVVRGVDLKHVWDRFTMKLNFLYSAKDQEFWKNLKTFVDALHPTTTADTIFTVVLPLIGFASGLFGGNQNHF